MGAGGGVYFAADGEPDDEFGAFAELGFDVDVAGVVRDDALADREAEAGAVRLGGEEGDEDVVELFAFDADAAVADADFDALALFLPAGGEGEGGAGGGG